jgi:hypothetical protein
MKIMKTRELKMKKIWSASNPVRPDRNPSHLAGKCQNLILKRASRHQYIIEAIRGTNRGTNVL